MAQPAQLIIETIARQRAELEYDPERRKRVRALQRFQVERLRRTYADYALQPRYQLALEFFVTDLYGPHDRGGRDRDLLKVLDQWARLLPERALRAVARAMKLELLTHALDVATVDALQGAPPDLDTYPRAYRCVGRFDDRRRQIDLILGAGRDLAALTEIPALGTALRVASVPASMLGVMQLHRFLERGYRAFKQMGRADALFRTIEQRETDIMQRLVEGVPDPFHAAHR
ncbi:MAG TPA: hypothetical protein VIU34_27795 [Steroidobacter sp.]